MSGAVGRLLDLLSANGEDARAVGGAVRNALLGLPVGEVDIATTTLPEEVIARAARAGLKSVPTGVAHGTVTVIVDGRPFEVTTLREDVETFGRHARVQFGRDWQRDAERRDFTINALSAGCDGVVHDYVGGLADLEERRVRFIGDPARRIAEDFLRILRFFRIHAAYGEGELDREGLEACAGGRDGLATLSAERVRAELLKLLVAKGAVAAIETMSAWGLLLPVVGSVPYRDTLAALVGIENQLGPDADALRRLAALTVAIPDDAAPLAAHLRLSRAEAARIESMASLWWRIDPTNQLALRGWLYRLGPERYRDRVMMAWARVGGHAADHWRDAVTLPDRWQAPPSPFNSADFMTRGLGAGPALGQALAWSEDEWIARSFPGDETVIAAIVDAAIKQFGATA
jgi:tRNA nucleotidyltransferase/poly(A) polymerase